MVLFLLILAAPAVLAGCPSASRNSSEELPNGTQTAKVPTKQAKYQLKGSFGGDGTPAGTFESLSAVAAGGGDVFAADRAYSYVHVFSREGVLKRSIGCGFKIEDYLKSDQELMEAYYDVEDNMAPELENQVALNRFFRPEDIEFSGGHIYVLSSFFSSLVASPKIEPSILEYTPQGQYLKTHMLSTLIMPLHFAVDKSGAIAGTDSVKNIIQISGGDESNLYVDTKLTANLRDYMSETIEAKGNAAKINAIKAKMSNTGIGRAQYMQISGIAAYTPVVDGEPHPESTKFIICDRGNKRLKVVSREGEILRLVAGTDGSTSHFGSPIDVAVDTNGRIFVLDAEGKVAVFDSNFASMGSFGEGELENPVSIDADESGEIWIADSGLGKILHYAPDK